MKLVLWVCIIFVPLAVFAQAIGTPVPLPSPGLTPVLLPVPSDSPSLIPTITGLISLARGFSSLGFYVALATALKYLVDVSQLSFLGAPLLKLPVKYQLLVRSGIAAIIAILSFSAAGAPIVIAIVSGLGTGAGSGFIHELLEDLSPGLSSAAAGVVAPPKPPSAS